MAGDNKLTGSVVLVTDSTVNVSAATSLRVEGQVADYVQQLVAQEAVA